MPVHREAYDCAVASWSCRHERSFGISFAVGSHWRDDALARKKAKAARLKRKKQKKL